MKEKKLDQRHRRRDAHGPSAEKANERDAKASRTPVPGATIRRSSGGRDC